MSPLSCKLRIPIAVGLLDATASVASAGWISLKNETKVTVVVHYVPESPTGKRGKMVRLLPGEVYREYQPRAGERLVQVLGTNPTTRVLTEARVKWPAEDVSLRIRQENADVKLLPVQPAKPGGAEAVVTVAKPVPDR